MATKKPVDERKKFYPSLAGAMKEKHERVRLMCQDPRFTQHEINRVQFLPLDKGIRLQFRWVAHEGVNLHIELNRHPKAKATQEGMKYWWPVIEQWQKLLTEWQGPVTVGGLGRLIAVMLVEKTQRVRYSTLARAVNALLQKELAKNRPSSAREILDYFNPKLRLDEVIDHAGPVTAEHVRERLRYARKETR